MENPVIFNWYRRPEKEVVEEGEFESLAEQGYVDTRTMVRRFRSAGEVLLEAKKNRFDKVEVEDEE